jgi:hypothetical protein
MFSPRITAVSHIEFTRAQFSHRIVSGQAVKQFTSTSCLHFRKELKLLYIPEQRYSANDRRKDFMIQYEYIRFGSCQAYPLQTWSIYSKSHQHILKLVG